MRQQVLRMLFKLYDRLQATPLGRLLSNPKRPSAVGRLFTLIFREPTLLVELDAGGGAIIKMYVDALDAMKRQFLQGEYERTETECLKAVTPSGGVMVDAGANWGYYSILGSRLVGPQGKVYAFEPAPHTSSLLVRNLRLNRCANVVAVSEALSDREGRMKFYAPSHVSAISSLSPENVRPWAAATMMSEVDVTTLDRFFERRVGNHRVDVVKMDLQGAEVKAFLGMRRLLAENRGIRILLEYWPFGLRSMGDAGREWLDEIRGAGYGIRILKLYHRTIPETDRHFSVEELIREHASMEADPGGYANLLVGRGVL